MVHIGNSWDDILADEFKKEYYLKLREFLKYEYSHFTVYPDMHDIFNSLKYTPYENVKAVIIGQDPYHGPGQAHGLCFSVKAGVNPPPSLQNIFKELQADLQVPLPSSGDLTPWARQGVLLLNTVLTVARGQANSHRDFGWQRFTDAIIDALQACPQPMAFVLWGAQAQKKAAAIAKAAAPRLILKAPHPSPLSVYRGFYGSRPFSKINAARAGADRLAATVAEGLHNLNLNDISQKVVRAYDFTFPKYCRHYCHASWSSG